jgi:hypothetical protein
MIYVFDTSSFIVLGHYFPTRFPSFWEKFDGCVSGGKILSVREVYKELDKQVAKPHLRDWIEKNGNIFLIPDSQETEFVRELFANRSFQALLKRKQMLTSGPAADPFVVASAKHRNGCVITEETKRSDAIRIPNVCEHYGIAHMSLEVWMEKEGWKF